MAGKPCFFQRRIGIATPMLLQFYRPCEIRKKITLLFSLPFDRPLSILTTFHAIRLLVIAYQRLAQGTGYSEQ
jgi:hypothetical protein